MGFTSVMHLVIATRPPTVTATLPGEPASVPIARRLIRATLAGCPRTDDLLLASTELAANAIKHSASGRGGSFTVQVRTELGWARVEVTDDGPALGKSLASNGWGLAIVADVTDRAGTATQPGGGRTTWTEVIWPI